MKRVRTWPPEHIAASLRELGLRFKDPSEQALATAEEQLLYVAEIVRRRKMAGIAQARLPTQQLVLDVGEAHT